ncbi:unnamed protein product [Prorocentrum cordatum]|uniref:Uncharacterized protein n=1 Tax=Prorocentrum cordatum TaxID=2364126 RepID=A0ABN9TYK1_9DINO|nr:unnamed protein product [Polarella glacialis]
MNRRGLQRPPPTTQENKDRPGGRQPSARAHRLQAIWARLWLNGLPLDAWSAAGRCADQHEPHVRGEQQAKLARLGLSEPVRRPGGAAPPTLEQRQLQRRGLGVDG